jgi:hypothetical protein
MYKRNICHPFVINGYCDAGGRRCPIGGWGCGGVTELLAVSPIVSVRTGIGGGEGDVGCKSLILQ